MEKIKKDIEQCQRDFRKAEIDCNKYKQKIMKNKLQGMKINEEMKKWEDIEEDPGDSSSSSEENDETQD